jgi:uncharacterized protein (DUF433 family)
MAPPLQLITVDPLRCGGEPRVRGLRSPVTTVLLQLAAGMTPEEVVAELPVLELEDVRECLRYAAWLASGRTLDTPPAA